MALSARRLTSSLWLTLLSYALLVRAQDGDGGATSGFSNSNLGNSGNGADGSSNSSANLSRGAIIGIAVVVAVVVLGGTTLAVLFYLAKKRQWQIRQSVRRTATRVVKAMTPRTATFGKDALSPRSAKSTDGFLTTSKDKSKRAAQRDGRDVEKGFTSLDEQLARSSEDSDKDKSKQHNRTQSDLNKKLPKPKPSINVPKSHFEMDSPKSPMWTRVFGRS